MQATNTTTFSSQQTPHISPVRSFFQSEFAKKIALIATAIIGMLAIIFLQEWGLPIVATLCVITFLATNTNTTKVSPPTPAATGSQPIASQENIDNESSDTYGLRTFGKALMKNAMKASVFLFFQNYGNKISIPIWIIKHFATNINNTETTPPATATGTQSEAVIAPGDSSQRLLKPTPSLEMPAYPEPQKTTASSKNIDNENSDTCDLKTCCKISMDGAMEAVDVACLLDSCGCCLTYASLHINNV